MNLQTAKRGAISSIVAALMLICALMMCACSGSTDESSNADSTDASQASIRVASLKGPTTIGLASLIQTEQQTADSAYDFQIYASGEEIAPLLTSGDVDIALIPANLAATLYNNTQGAIKVIDINTLGVLYALTADEALKQSNNVSFADLKGRTIYMTGKGTVPEYTVQALLEASGLTEQDVTIEFQSEPSAVVEMISKDDKAVGILPQPYVTAALAQNSDLADIMDLTLQWDSLAQAEEEGANLEPKVQGQLVTGVTVVRSDFFEQSPDTVWQFVDLQMASANTANEDPASIAQEVVDLGIVGSEAIAEQAIPQCNVTCITAEDMKDDLSGYLNSLYAIAPESIGGQLPDDDFYLVG